MRQVQWGADSLRRYLISASLQLLLPEVQRLVRVVTLVFHIYILRKQQKFDNIQFARKRL